MCPSHEEGQPGDRADKVRCGSRSATAGFVRYANLRDVVPPNMLLDLIKLGWQVDAAKSVLDAKDSRGRDAMD